MLVIRNDQIRALDDDLRQRWISDHLATYFSGQFGALPLNERAGFVAHAVRRATDLGIRSSSGLCLYATLALLLGPAFDSDTNLPWVSAHLHAENGRSADERIEAVYDEAVRYLSAD